MDRAEAAGLGVATAGHLALLATLSLGLAATRIKPPQTVPIEVAFVDESALESQAPVPSAEAPAPKLAEADAPPEPAAAPPIPEPQPQPVPAPPTPAPPKPAPPPPAPAPRAAPKPTPRPAQQQPQRPAPAKPAPPRAAAPAPAKPAPARRPTGGRLTGLLSGLSDQDSPSRATTPPAAKAGPAVEAALTAEVKRQLKPHWQKVVPSGADAESLRTTVTIHLAQDGRVTAVDDVKTTGITASNRPQVALHQERAKKAVMLASPFRLPAEYYDAWKEITATLDLRLSQ
ncbi:MAG: TonB C-terminal domain-containing protein [Alphaproteobacteria bacterium]|nr:MAG: TonB C-terminal domain-containing protein [Alphaproteobacteria bacterium]